MRIFSAVSLLVTPVLTDAVAPVPLGFGYLGHGYDYLLGNPLDTQGETDLGFKSAIFEFVLDSGKTTADGKWTVPEKSTVVSMPACSQNVSGDKVSNSKDYYSAQNVSVGLNLGFKDALPGDAGMASVAFKFNVDTHNVHQETTTNGNVFYFNKLQCSALRLNMNLFDHPPVSANFQMGVKFLPSTYGEWQYMTFIQQFGTHVVHRVDGGGRWGWQAMIKSSEVYKMELEGYNVGVGLEDSAYVTVGFGIKVAHDIRQAHRVCQAISRNSTYNLGGGVAVDPAEWARSVEQYAMPMQVELVPLHMLINPMYLPGQTDLPAKKAALADAINNKYCHYLKKNNPKYSYVECPTKSEDDIIV